MWTQLGFLFLCLCMIVGSARGDDVAALLEFFKGVNPNGGCMSLTWTSNTVASGACPSSFCGVSCSEGAVVGLDLSGHGLQGRIPESSLAKLKMLASLDLSDNMLSGELPQDLGNLTNLQHLDLSHNQLKGSIPVGFSSLQKLSALNLSSNLFTGTIPTEISLLSGLKSLDLHDNLLSGEISPDLLALSSLSTIDLSSNRLTGFLPWQPNDTLPLLRTVEYVNLSNNLLTGPLAPPKFSSVFAEKLRVLDMSNNLLSGNLPDFEFVISLVSLKLNNNSFTGSVPPTLLSATLGLLEQLDLSHNNLTGNVTRVLSSSLKYLNLSYNSLSGPLPQKLGSCSVVDLSHNNIFGDLSSLQYWTDMLEVLDLSSNAFSGELMGDMSKFVRLRSINFSNNALTGSIPSSYGLLPKMSLVDLSFNELSGTLPESFFNSSTLSYLVLSNNQLSGEIPLQGESSFTSVSSYPTLESSTDLPQLTVMDLSNNKLDGSISDAISRYKMLKDLDLGKNQLFGTIPIDISNLTLLEVLDLSDNLLSGSIPPALPSSLVELQLANNNLSGQIPENLRRFPNSTFFPGNEGLFSPWPLTASPGTPIMNTFTSRKGGFDRDVKAGLIAGSMAGFALLLVLGLVLYYKHVSKTQGYGVSKKKDVDIPTATKDIGHKMWSPCSAYFTPENSHTSNLSSGKNYSSDLLLDRPSDGDLKSKGRSWEKREAVDDSAKIRNMMELSPSSTRQKPSPARTGEERSSPVILKVRSPDKLAGDLHFLDKTLRFTAEELSRAPAEVLGRSSHGTSYKATLDNGHALTVKWLREGLAKSKKEFGREASKFTKVRHPNIVPMRGYYWGPREHEKLILSDFVSRGSLAAHFADKTGQRYPPLSWQVRLVISVDVARGLLYLHDERHLAHGNLKATNVMIDGPSLSARLADYGLHQLMTPEGTANQIVNAGALGYRAPELATMKKPKPTFKGDIYALGVLMLELLTGQGAGDIISGQSGAVDLTDWVRLLASEVRAFDCFDPVLVAGEKSQELLAGMEEMLALALKCISQHPADRPNIRTVYEELSAISA